MNYTELTSLKHLLYRTTEQVLTLPEEVKQTVLKRLKDREFIRHNFEAVCELFDLTSPYSIGNSVLEEIKKGGEHAAEFMCLIVDCVANTYGERDNKPLLDGNLNCYYVKYDEVCIDVYTQDTIYAEISQLYEAEYLDNVCTDYEVFLIHYLAKCDY